MNTKLLVATLVLMPVFTATAQSTDSQRTAESPTVLKLEDTIRGSREQPKVLSIVPWQPPTDKAALPSPVLDRINQEFMPLEREEFVRRVVHFEKLSNQ